MRKIENEENIKQNDKNDINETAGETKKSFFTKEKVIIIISIVILCACIVYIGIWTYQTNKNKRQMSDLENEILINNEEQENPVVEAVDDAEAQELISQRNSIDFDKLYEINSDTKGWLRVDALGISYPIMQYTDNDYYLGKNIYKEDSIAGSIFLDYRNNGFDDNHTIIYGHNMKNDSMFGKLDLIGMGECGTDVDIIVQTKEKSYKYKVFSTYEIDPKNFSRSIDIGTMMERSVLDFGKEVSEGSKILTLYTCTNATKEKIIVHSYLEREI